MAYRSLLCLAIMALSSYLAPPVLAAQYVVDQHHPQASDDNPGTAEAPWLTISQAAKTVQPGDIVTIRAGLYREALTPWASGTIDAPISPDWEAGGFKLCGTRGIKLLRCTALRNVADGMWFDLDDFAGEVRPCRCQHSAKGRKVVRLPQRAVVTDL